MAREVVITGLGPVTPNGIGKRKFWNNISKGKSFFEIIPVIKNRNYGEIKGSEIKNFKLDDYFLKEVKQKKFNRANYANIKSSDKAMQFAVLGTKLALEDAVLDYNVEENNIQVFIGNAEGLIQSTEHIEKLVIQKIMRKTFEAFDKNISSSNFFKVMKEFIKYEDVLQEEQLEKFIDVLHERHGNLYEFIPPNKDFKSYAINGKISSFFDFHGQSVCINTACSAGLDAIGMAYYSIKDNYSDIVIAGGSEAPITLQTISLLDNLGVVSRTKPKPYCADRDGFALSEGAGIVVLEEKQHALERGAKIYAEIKGYSQSNDANNHMAALNPEGKYLKKGIEKALKMSGLNTEEIDYINTHGTATQACDSIETKVIKEIFKEHAHNINISSTKSMTGHSIGAVGAIETIISALAIENQVAPPTINLYNPDPNCDLNYTPNHAVKRSIENSLITSMGFGGYNTALILSKYDGR